MTEATGRRPQRIAVIAVHGVGDQQPFESARAIGDLLQNIDADPSPLANRPEPCATPPAAVQPQYDPFVERTIRINVRPLVITDEPRAAVAAARDAHATFHQFVEQQRREGRRPYEDDAWYAFMRGQLRCYHGEGPEETYETVRLEGRRTVRGAPEQIVHVYEAYWADLSRLKAGIFSIFTELYQLLFHLSSIGTHVVDAEALHHSGRSWSVFHTVQRYASVWLTVPVVIVNLFTVCTVALVFGLLRLRRLPPAIQMEIVACAIATAGAAAAGSWLWRARNQRVWLWSAPFAAALAIAVVAWRALHGRCGGAWPFADDGCTQLLALSRGSAAAILAAAATVALWLVIGAYDQHRPGAKRAASRLGPILLATVAATLAVTRSANPTADRAIFVAFRALEVLYLAALAAWGGFFALSIVAFVAGAAAVRRVGGADRDRARRSLWTGRLMLGIPSFSFAVIAMAAWGAVNSLLATRTVGIAYAPVVTWFPAPTVSALLERLQEYGGARAWPVLMAAAGVAAIPAVWGLAPVVWPEIVPPDFWSAREGKYADRLGDWLTVTYRGLRISGELLYFTMIPIVPLIVGSLLILRATGAMGWFAWADYVLKNFNVLGGLSGAVFAWLFAARGKVKKAALGFRSGLDILLDVDNWLREHPLNRNPKARICGRYVSLLRYLCDWRDPFDAARGYDAIVVVAHSQGTVITADLFRFLLWESRGFLPAYDATLARLDEMPVTLFTMGCPLRDLYALRFPRLYAWARHEDTAAMREWSANDLSVDRRSSEPNPAELGVVRWINAYRSGDYIGRYLWRTIPCGYLWTSDLGGVPFDAPARSVSSDGRHRTEFCIGAGGHTHYWDRTAPTIALELDRLIATAV